MIYHNWLVVWNMFFQFHVWDVILPIDELHHFSRWLKASTSYIVGFRWDLDGCLLDLMGFERD